GLRSHRWHLGRGARVRTQGAGKMGQDRARQRNPRMNGAESLIRTLQGAGVDTCFSNPGTSEMHFVGAFDRVADMRCVLTLFDGIAVGASDGYARMADKPALSLLHLGGGLANGLSNLHNAQKARTPML